MAKPPQAYLETDAEYDWRMAARHPERYPLQSDDHRHDARIARGRFWQHLGELTGIWRPFLRWAGRADLLD